MSLLSRWDRIEKNEPNRGNFRHDNGRLHRVKGFYTETLEGTGERFHIRRNLGYETIIDEYYRMYSGEIELTSYKFDGKLKSSLWHPFLNGPRTDGTFWFDSKLDDKPTIKQVKGGAKWTYRKGTYPFLMARPTLAKEASHLLTFWDLHVKRVDEQLKTRTY